MNHQADTHHGHDLPGLLPALYERYPLLDGLAFTSSVTQTIQGPVPPFVGMLLSTIEAREVGASCVLLPSRKHLGFAVAVLSALTLLKRSFDEIELDRLTTPFPIGSLVRVSPVDRVFEVMEDGKEFRGQRWILLKNPSDEQIHYIPEAEAFRLTPTDLANPLPRKGMKPGRWTPAPVDQLLGIRTGGNLAVVPNQVVLVAPRGETSELADSALVAWPPNKKASASGLVTWGRIDKVGRIVSEDGPRQPMIAVTHSVDHMAAACRQPGAAGKIVIVEGARSLAGNLSAYDDAVLRHRLLILSDHSELDQVSALVDRECDMWAPRPDTILVTSQGVSMDGGWFSGAATAARNCRDLRVIPISATDAAVERLHDTICDLSATGAGAEHAGRLLGQAWLIIATVAGWLERPGSAALEFLARRLADVDAGLQRDRIWLTPEIANGVEQFLDVAGEIQEADAIGERKRDELLRFLQATEEVAVVTRSAPGAARLKGIMERAGLNTPIFPIASLPDERYGDLVACSWPGRRMMSRLASRYRSPQIHVLSYPFEELWLSAFSGRWSREWTRYAQSAEEVARITGLTIWQPPKHEAPDPVPREEDRRVEDDPVSLVLSRRRKGRGGEAVPEKDATEARYVGFHGSGYCFLTEGHKVPVLTDLVVGGELASDRVPLRPVRKLITGDFLLFRDHGDQDVISTIAERELGSGTYNELRRIADLWRPALRSISSDPYTIWQKLRSAGLDRSAVTVRVWLTDGDRIGPRSERDLKVIARVSADHELSDRMDEVSTAIRTVWAAHIRAGFVLSGLLLRELPQKLPEIDEGGCRVEFTFGAGWIVCIDEIADGPDDRPYWEVNRLLFEEEG